MASYAGPVPKGYSESIYRNFGQTVQSKPQNIRALPQTGPSYSPPKPQVLGASIQQSQNNQAQQTVTSNQDAGNAQIEADFNSAMEMLNSSESGLRAQAGTAEGQIVNEAAKAKTTLQDSQATQAQGVNTAVSTAERQSAGAIQQARDLFRETQQKNNSQLSALGISSSSVSQALAERLGVETARRIAGVTGSLQEVKQNAVQELNRIQKYFSDRTTQLDEDVRIQKGEIQNSLIQGINQINSAKNQAAQAKAAARSNLLSQVQSQLGQLAQQEQQFKQSLEAWAAQKSAALTPIAQDPNYVQNLLAQTQKINEQFSPSGFVATPSFNVNAQGQYTGQINTQKKPEEDVDPMVALLKGYGVQ